MIETITTSSSGAYQFSFTFILILIYLLRIIFWCAGAYAIYLLIRSLRKYLGERTVSQETAAVRKTLGETIKEYRTACKMTQEFVAEHLGVSRQAVSKWENGTSDPSTANLLALAKLFGVSAAELLKNVAE